MIDLPDISTNYAKIFVSTIDKYGFSGSDDSDDYFIIGTEYEQCSFGMIWNGTLCECPPYYSWNGSLCIYELQEHFEEFDQVSSNFIVDVMESAGFV